MPTWAISRARTAAISRMVSRRNSPSVTAIAAVCVGGDGEGAEQRAGNDVEDRATNERGPFGQLGDEGIDLLESPALVQPRAIEPHHHPRRQAQRQSHYRRDGEDRRARIAGGADQGPAASATRAPKAASNTAAWMRLALACRFPSARRQLRSVSKDMVAFQGPVERAFSWISLSSF